ncbi:TetR/AcrR family transcriptional regulator [Bifidobacterium cuniculi]|uniref:TetR-type transcriptional regulator n=1 Tax=Bifidobacterium cuniculi TaxID=1688 RepID=A0A087AZN9_9BIFI|nr:TetR/AcrR family transcriptional regulator [Bifidobacterium cuniculi]KFI64239.1 TetR-type transcriptional regulator [Bifidobacterium cuniculi]
MPIAAWQQILEQFSDGTGRRAPLASHEITARDTTSHQGFVKRKRMSQEERQLQILRAAGMVIAVKGYWGMTLQDISDEIGLSEAALYHYIDSKEDLLDMVLTEGYDTTEANEFSALTASVSDVDGHRVYFFPRYLLNTVLYNMQRPEMTQLFCVLSGEALNPDHPAHRFFTGRHNRLWEMVGSMSWLLPPGIDEEKLFDLYTLAASAIDGLQTRWLADDSLNLVDEWVRFSETIFPAATWTGYLDPSEHDPEDTRCLLPYTLQER